MRIFRLDEITQSGGIVATGLCEPNTIEAGTYEVSLMELAQREAARYEDGEVGWSTPYPNAIFVYNGETKIASFHVIPDA